MKAPPLPWRAKLVALLWRWGALVGAAHWLHGLPWPELYQPPPLPDDKE